MVSLVVLNYNGHGETINFVDSIIQFNNLDNIIIVDNASTDNSLSIFKNKYNTIDKIHVISSEKNGGYAYGNNIGIKYGIEKLGSDYVIISNPDVGIDNSDIIDEMKVVFTRLNDVGVVAPKMNIPENKNNIVAWKLPGLIDDILLTSGILKRFLGNPVLYNKRYLNSAKYLQVDILPGSFFMVSRESIMAVDYLDEGTFLYGEERILGRKMRDKGYSEILITDLNYTHYHSKTISKNIKGKLRTFKYLCDSRYYYQVKYNKIDGIQKLIFRIVLFISRIEKIIYGFLERVLQSGKSN